MKNSEKVAKVDKVGEKKSTKRSSDDISKVFIIG